MILVIDLKLWNQFFVTNIDIHHNFHSYSGSYEDKTMGLYDDGDEFNKHVVLSLIHI